MISEDLVQLVNTSAHAFRHTLRHASGRAGYADRRGSVDPEARFTANHSIYVKAEKRRMFVAAARYFADDDVE